MGAPMYSVIIPMYNEQQVIAETYIRLKEVLDETREMYELVFVNDGSQDRTEEIVKLICQNDENVRLISFSRNFGHQVALKAGLDHAGGDAVMIIDADLQDPPRVLLEMIRKWKEGYEVVYGKRVKREGESGFKKTTAWLFYRILRKLTDLDIPRDAGDFRLIDKRVKDALCQLKEKKLFIRGMVSWVGFKQTFVEYVREERWAGETKYPLRKMLNFAGDAVTSLSYKPLKLATYFGFALTFLSFAYILIILYQKIFTNGTEKGWASLLATSLLLNGITLMMLGLIGEYVGRIYEQTKERPLYIVREKTGFKQENDNRK